jgi:tetratricopeptide (TPR) repeat protein
MLRLPKHILLLFSCLAFQYSHSQYALADSLIHLLNTDKEDTTRINHLNLLATELRNNDPDTGLIVATQALGLSKKTGWKKGEANALTTLGICCIIKADYNNGLQYFTKALELEEALNNQKGIAKLIGNIGIVYYSKGDYSKALDYYFRSLKMEEQLGNKKKISGAYGNIGLIYYRQDNFEKGLNYYFRSLKIIEELLEDAVKKKDEAEIADCKGRIAIQLGNIGIAYYEQRKYSAALAFDTRGLKLAEETGNKHEVGRQLGNIGVIYDDLKDYTKALDYYLKALRISEELGDKNSIARHMSNIGLVYSKTHRLKEGEAYLLAALKLDEEIGAKNELEHVVEKLSELYNKKGDHKLAFEYYRRAMMLKDSLFNEEKNNEITRKEINYEFEMKQAAEKAEHDKQMAVAAADKKRQNLFLWFTGVGLILTLVVALYILRSLSLTRKQKQVIEDQKIIVENQKHLVEEKQKEILDSIHYAQRIQKALIPSERFISKMIKSKNS